MTEDEIERMDDLTIIIVDSALCKLELTKEFLSLLGKAIREIEKYNEK